MSYELFFSVYNSVVRLGRRNQISNQIWLRFLRNFGRRNQISYQIWFRFRDAEEQVHPEGTCFSEEI